MDTPMNLQKLVEELQIDTIDDSVNRIPVLGDEQKNGLVHSVILESIKHPIVAPIYVELLIKWLKKEFDNDFKASDIYKRLILTCEHQFETKIKPTADFRHEQQRAVYIGYIRFLGVLYVRKVLCTANAKQIALELLNIKNNCHLDCYYEFMAVINMRNAGSGTKGSLQELNKLRQLNQLHRDILKAILECPDINLIPETRVRLEKLLSYLSDGAEHPLDLILGDFDPGVKHLLNPSS